MRKMPAGSPLAHARINFLCGDVDAQFLAFLKAKEEAAFESAAAAPAHKPSAEPAGETVSSTLSGASTLSHATACESQPETQPSEVAAAVEDAADAVPASTVEDAAEDAGCSASAECGEAETARTRNTAGDRAVCWASTRPTDVVAAHFTPGVKGSSQLAKRRSRRGTPRPLPAIVSSQAA